MQTKHKLRKNLSKDSYKNLIEGTKIWTSFYRANPHRFALDYLGINIHIFQQFLLKEINDNNQSVVSATRGKLPCPII